MKDLLSRIGQWTEKMWRSIPIHLRDAIFTALLLGIAAAICFVLRSIDENGSFTLLIFVLAVVIISRFTEGYFWGVFSSLFGVICVNFVFTYPFWAFNFRLTGYPLTFLTMLAVSLIIIVVGVQLGLESIDKIISPEPVDAGLVPMLVLVASICVKGYMFAYNRGIGRKINSPGMSATAMDSLSDSIATSVVLISMLLARFADVNVDGWGGAAVAVFIIFSGFKAAKETLSPLLGNPPDPQLVRDITDIVMSHPEVLNVHDLIVHDYGPGRLMISLHAEVPGDGDIYALHDAIDTAEYELQQKLGCSAVIHMDPVSPDGTKTAHMREELAEAAKAIDPRLTIHDFRIVDGPTHTNVIFDAVLPNNSPVTEGDAKAQLETIVHSLWQNSHPKVHIDRPFV